MRSLRIFQTKNFFFFCTFVTSAYLTCYFWKTVFASWRDFHDESYIKFHKMSEPFKSGRSYGTTWSILSFVCVWHSRISYYKTIGLFWTELKSCSGYGISWKLDRPFRINKTKGSPKRRNRQSHFCSNTFHVGEPKSSRNMPPRYQGQVQNRSFR